MNHFSSISMTHDTNNTITNDTIQQLRGRAFLAFPEMMALLRDELEKRFGYDSTGSEVYGDLLYCPDFPEEREETPYFASTTYLQPFKLSFTSITEAASGLKAIQRNWAPYQYQLFRRAALIQEKLPYINLKERTFPFEIPHSPMGAYTLIDEHTIIASALTSSPLPAGRLHFVEDHENPPSRAYLKIQESLTLFRYYFGEELPKANEKCFEAGACPGGWTWVLVNLGAQVFAVDRAELAPSLMKNPLVTFQAHDAFTLKPDEIGAFDWIFSDVICYPERLFEWVNMWLESGKVRNMICTIKMQGEIDYDLVHRFASLPNSKVVHLNYNKHELTWLHGTQPSL